MEKVFGPEHPHTLTSVYCLAHLLASQRRCEDALALYKRACSGYEVVLGKDHPTTRSCHQHYANALAAEHLGQSTLLPSTVDSSTSMRKGKESKLLRGLAKIGMRSSKELAKCE